jgi:hypothetical protein
MPFLGTIYENDAVGAFPTVFCVKKFATMLGSIHMLEPNSQSPARWPLLVDPTFTVSYLTLNKAANVGIGRRQDT